MDSYVNNNNNANNAFKRFRASPTYPMDIHTFANLRKSEGEDARGNKSTIFSWVPLGGPEQEIHIVQTVWLVAYVKSCRIRQQKPSETTTENLPFNLDLEVRDGTGQLKIVQFRTSLGEPTDGDTKISPFLEEQYYSFIIKPFLSKSPNDTLTHGAVLISFHKISNFNEITAHLSQFVRARQYLISPMKLTVAKLIRGYSANNQGLRREVLQGHLSEYLDQNNPNYQHNATELDQYLQFLVSSGMVTENADYGLMAVSDDQQQ